VEHVRKVTLRRLALLIDAAIILGSMLLADAVHSLLRAHFELFKAPPGLRQYLLLGYLTLPMMLGLVALLGQDRHFEEPSTPRQLVLELLKLHAAALLGISVLLFFTQIPMNRSVVGLFLVLTFVSMLATRAAIQAWRHRSYLSGLGREHVLLVAEDAETVRRILHAGAGAALPPHYIGVLVPDDAGAPDPRVAGIPALGRLADLPRILHERAVDKVVIATRRLPDEEFQAVIGASASLGKPVQQLLQHEATTGRAIDLQFQHGLPYVVFSALPHRPDALIVKRAIDLLGSSILLVVLSPLILLTASLILVTKGRPVLFRQQRIGYHGRRFDMLKFRSMVPGAEQMREALLERNETAGPTFKAADDPRITRLGRILRRTSIDELPQLFNVLAGSMSLVGPRPLPVQEQQQIEGALRRRLSMRPGITGLWQVSGRSDIGFEEWMKLDLQYVDNWSLKLDLRLLIKTIPVVLTGRGAR